VRIGFVLPGFSATPDDWCIPALRNLVQHLAVHDEVRVLALRYPGTASRHRIFGADVVALGGGTQRGAGSLDLWWRVLLALAREHGCRPFDLLHAFWATEAGALTAVAGRILRVPTVVSLAGGELVALPRIGYGDQLVAIERAKVGLALRLTTVITAGSRSTLDLARPWLRGRPSGRIRYLPLGVDTEMFRPVTTEKMVGPTRLVHVASLVPVKDQATLLRAVARLKPHETPWSLDVVGAGPLEPSLRALAEDLGVARSVCFRGPIDHGRLPAIYRQADLFVLSSRHEAQGMAALEAAACGLPVVGTRVGIIPEIAPQAAVDVPTEDPAAFGDAIDDLVRDSERRRALGDAARARAVDDFSLARSVERFRQVYCDITRSPGRRHGG
jgi:glycosyltransferase involved in cell wall biosynthesis